MPAWRSSSPHHGHLDDGAAWVGSAACCRLHLHVAVGRLGRHAPNRADAGPRRSSPCSEESATFLTSHAFGVAAQAAPRQVAGGVGAPAGAALARDGDVDRDRAEVDIGLSKSFRCRRPARRAGWATHTSWGRAPSAGVTPRRRRHSGRTSRPGSRRTRVDPLGISCSFSSRLKMKAVSIVSFASATQTVTGLVTGR